MTEIRFKNLPSLLKDMEQKKWIIDSFLFQYKDEKYIVILKRYKDNERKLSEHAVAKVEFIRSTNENESIKGYVDFYKVRFDNTNQFCDFFGVEKGKASRNVFIDFSNIFSNYIPLKKVIEKS